MEIAPQSYNNPPIKFPVCQSMQHDIPDSPDLAPSRTVEEQQLLHMTMKSEQHRLMTYDDDNWRRSHCTMDVKILAKNGFYYFGHEDHVRCAFCKVEIGRWEPDDDCAIDHQRWAPRCQFIRGYDVGNIPIDAPQSARLLDRSEDTCGAYGLQIRPNSRPEDLSNHQDVNVEVNIKNIATPHTGPRHREYCTEESRMTTFKEWPRVIKQKPLQLAEAGFFYTGRGDQTICFHCGGGLKDWEENDDPWEQHARWFSKCTHVLINKGSEYIQEIVNKYPPVLTSVQAQNLVCSTSSASETTMETESTPTTVETKSHGETLTLLKPEVKLLSKTVTSTADVNSSDSQSTDGCMCKICYNELWSVLFLPCKHALACKKCASALSSCPLCRKSITATMTIFPTCSHNH